MAEVLESPGWQAVGLVVDQTARDFLARRYTLVEDLQAWFKAVELFRDTQDERMVLRDPTPDDLRQHKTWIAGLIAEGERFTTESQARGGVSGRIQLADVQATLEMLYLFQREWHGPRLPEARRRELLQTVFHVEEPAA